VACGRRMRQPLEERYKVVVFRVSERLGVSGRDVSILHAGGDRPGYLSCVTQTRSAT